MTKLSSDWFLEGIQDYEYKKYILLGYLKWARERLDDTHLYPTLSQLVDHYRNLNSFYHHLTELKAQFPYELTGVDMEAFRLQYRRLVEDDERLQEVEDIVGYALPRVKELLDEGKEIFELIEQCIEIGEVGLLPLNRSAGYFLLRGGETATVKAYQYQITVFENSHERYRSIQTEHVGDFRYGLAHTFEMIKLELIRRRRGLPNPATFFIHSKLGFPEREALVPVAKRIFMRHLAQLDQIA
ncbi:MAG: hypothetical protein AAGN35_11665 [Bacteroidota bacterium]